MSKIKQGAAIGSAEIGTSLGKLAENLIQGHSGPSYANLDLLVWVGFPRIRYRDSRPKLPVIRQHIVFTLNAK